jgi:hypothetical protein
MFMERSPRAAVSFLACAAVFSLHVIFATISAQGQDLPSVRRVQVLGNRNPVEIEIEASDRLVPSTQVLTGPDRLVVDFPNAVPAAQLRNQTLDRGEVKSVRVGLFTAKPPVTRVVIDLSGPQAYQVFPSGRTVIIRVGSAGPQTLGFNPSSSSGPRLVNSNYPVQSVQIAAPAAPPPLVVSFKAGKLTINSNKASLSEVLFAVHQRTGADIAIPAGAEQEKVVAQIGPGSAPEVLSQLLTGTRFNFLILSTENDPGTLDRVILSARPDGPGPAQPLQQMPPAEDDPEANAPPPPPPAPAPNPNPSAGRQKNPANPQSDNIPD